MARSLGPISPATRRRFPEASVSTAVATWLGPVATALSRGSATAEGERSLGTVPFVGEGAFPLGATIGSGLGRRRALDLSTLSAGSVLTPESEFFIRTGLPLPPPPPTSLEGPRHRPAEAPPPGPLWDLQRDARPPVASPPRA